MKAPANVRTALVALVLAAGLLAACGGETIERKESSATVGQQMLDLQKAYEQGIITKEEYEQAKKRMLNR